MSMQYEYVLLFLVLAVNSDWFQILGSYTLLLQPPTLMWSYLPKCNSNLSGSWDTSKSEMGVFSRVLIFH